MTGRSKIVTKRSKIILRPIERFERSWKRRSRPNFEIERPKGLESIPSMVARRSYEMVRGRCEIVVMGWIITRRRDVFDEGRERSKESFEAWQKLKYT